MLGKGQRCKEAFLGTAVLGLLSYFLHSNEKGNIDNEYTSAYNSKATMKVEMFFMGVVIYDM